MITLLWISIPFAVAVAVLFGIGQMVRGWEGLSWVVYGMVAAAAWAVVAVGFCLYAIMRDGPWTAHGLPLALLAVVVVAAAAWGLRNWQEQARCNDATAFVVTFAEAAPARRPALLEGSEDRLAAMDYCGRDMVEFRFGRDRYADSAPDPSAEADRLAALALLLEHGLPPDERMFYGAIASADPPLVSLVVMRRQILGPTAGEPVPLRFALQALDEVDMDPTSPYHADVEAYLEILRIFVAAGLDLCQQTGSSLTLRQEMEHKSVPREIWHDAGAC